MYDDEEMEDTEMTCPCCGGCGTIEVDLNDDGDMTCDTECAYCGGSGVVDR